MTATKIAERRRNPRGKPVQLVYIEFGTDNGGMIKNVSEGGMRFFLMNPVITGHKLHFGMTIDPLRRIEGDVSIIWSDPSGKSGGLSFAGLSPTSQRTLRSWLSEMDGASSGQPSLAVAEVPTDPASTISQPQAGSLPPLEKVLLPAAETSPAGAAMAASPGAIAPPPAALPASPVVVVPPRLAKGPTSVAERLLPNAPVLTYDTPRLATREEWRRALHEDSARAEKPKSETSPEKMIAALIEPPLTTAPAPNALSAPPQTRAESPASQPALSASHPPTSFPTPPPARVESQSFAKPRREQSVLDEPPEPPNLVPRITGVSRTRLAMILALAAICGAAAAFAGIAYRRNVGESLIAIGKKISGDSPPSAASNVEQANPTAPPESSSSVQTGTPQEAPHPPPVQRNPVDTTQKSETVMRDTPRDTPVAKSKPPQEDISSLWVAVQNGDAAAEVVLANHYIAGDGVVKNCEQARVLLEAAAKRGNPAASKRLADLPSTGCP